MIPIRIQAYANKSPFTHPVTGVVHTVADVGWEPEVLSWPCNEELTRWKTSTMHLPKACWHNPEFDAVMQRQADALSQITGMKISWIHITDAVNFNGEYGFFTVEK